jgi:hypothetical protein
VNVADRRFATISDCLRVYLDNESKASENMVELLIILPAALALTLVRGPQGVMAALVVGIVSLLAQCFIVEFFGNSNSLH